VAATLSGGRRDGGRRRAGRRAARSDDDAGGSEGHQELAIPRPAELLQRHGIHARKGLGQHFLVDRAHLARIVNAAELKPDDVVLEVGPGLGVLTEALSDRAGHVIAVEIDEAMRAVLHERLASRANLRIVAADVLETDPAELVAGALGARAPQRGRVAGYKVVANLPYYITSAVLRHVLEARLRPERCVVMVQREVAERMMAGPGQMSILAVATQLYAHPSRVAIVPGGAFYPRPKVDSAVVRLDVHPNLAVDVADVDAFFEVVRAGFGQKRKQLRNSLASGLDLPPPTIVTALEAAGVSPKRRAQTLALAEWAAVARSLADVR